MEENDFVIKKEGSILQVYLGFELSMANSTTLREMLSEYRGQDINRIVYDATDLVFLSSSGIRTILFAMQEIGDEPEIVFVNCANEISETFKIAGLANFFSFVDDERKIGEAGKNGSDGSEWEQEYNMIRQEQLDKFAAHNDVVACQMKLGQNEDE
jgi:anti-anti-sigma factor